MFVQSGQDAGLLSTRNSNRCLPLIPESDNVRVSRRTGGAMSAEQGLTERQHRILEVIRETVAARGYPPSVREIGEAVGLRSPSSVHSQLAALERGGYLRKDPSRPRAIEGHFDPDKIGRAHV